MAKKRQELSWEDLERKIFTKSSQEYVIGENEVQTVLYEKVCVGCDKREMRIDVTYAPLWNKSRILVGVTVLASYDVGECPFSRNVLLCLINNWNDTNTLPNLFLQSRNDRAFLCAKMIIDFNITQEELDFTYLRRDLCRDIPLVFQTGMGKVLRDALACGLDDDLASEGMGEAGNDLEESSLMPFTVSRNNSSSQKKSCFSGKILKGNDITAALSGMARFFDPSRDSVRALEIAILLKGLRKKNARALLVYGRRSVGKTHFIADFIRALVLDYSGKEVGPRYLLILSNSVSMEKSYELLSSIPDNCIIYATGNWLAHCYMPTLFGGKAEERDFWSSNLPDDEQEEVSAADTAENDICAQVQEQIKEIIELGSCRFIAELPIEREEDRPALAHVYGQANDSSKGLGRTRRNLLSYLNFYTKPQTLLSELGRMIVRYELQEPSPQQLAVILGCYVNWQNARKRGRIPLSGEGIDLVARIAHAYGDGSESSVEGALTLLNILTKLPPQRMWGDHDIREAASCLFNMASDKVVTRRSSRIQALRDELRNDIIGQELAINTIVDALIVSEAGLNEKHRPKVSALCVGPSGVGKTELAKSLAKCHFGTEDALIQIDMSAFQNADTVFKLIGFSPGYKGAEMGGQLTGAVWRRPHSVILFDEIEKCHPNVRDLLLQILEEGNLEDGWGLKVSFENCIVLITTNVGSSLLGGKEAARGIGFVSGMEESMPEATVSGETLRAILDELGSVFRPETLNRFDSIIVFNPLVREQCRAIAVLQIDRIFEVMHDRGITLIADESLVDYLLEIGFDPQKGARPLRRAASGLLKKPIAIALDEESIVPGCSYRVAYDESSRAVLFVPFTSQTLD